MFDFDFKRLKLIELDQTSPVQLNLNMTSKNKVYIYIYIKKSTPDPKSFYPFLAPPPSPLLFSLIFSPFNLALNAPFEFWRHLLLPSLFHLPYSSIVHNPHFTPIIYNRQQPTHQELVLVFHARPRSFHLNRVFFYWVESNKNFKIEVVVQLSGQQPKEKLKA